jgi:hypothetical protein
MSLQGLLVLSDSWIDVQNKMDDRNNGSVTGIFDACIDGWMHIPMVKNAEEELGQNRPAIA